MPFQKVGAAKGLTANLERCQRWGWWSVASRDGRQTSQRKRLPRVCVAMCLWRCSGREYLRKQSAHWYRLVLLAWPRAPPGVVGEADTGVCGGPRLAVIEPAGEVAEDRGATKGGLVIEVIAGVVRGGGAESAGVGVESSTFWRRWESEGPAMARRPLSDCSTA